MTTFTGVFKPPVRGKDRAKVAGPGQCEITDSGLNIQAYEQSPMFSLWFILGLFLVMFCVALVFPPIVLPGALVVGFLISSGKGKGKDYKRRKPLTLALSWEQIQLIGLEPKAGLITIQIRPTRHKGEAYQGTLFFAPDDDPAKVLNTLHRQQLKQQP